MRKPSPVSFKTFVQHGRKGGNSMILRLIAKSFIRPIASGLFDYGYFNQKCLLCTLQLNYVWNYTNGRMHIRTSISTHVTEGIFFLSNYSYRTR